MATHDDLLKSISRAVSEEQARLRWLVMSVVSGAVKLSETELMEASREVIGLQHDARLSLSRITDINTAFLAFDQQHDTLPGGDASKPGGRNPFRDLRVRRAVYQAVNIDLIIEKVLRGQGIATGALFAPIVEGNLPELEKRLRYDPVAARALLAEAGWPQGFDVPMECVNVPYRERICQAVAAMLAQVGIRARLHTSPGTQFFSMVTQGSAPLLEYGWTATSDAWANLNGLLHTWTPAGGGTFNAGRYSNPQLDLLIDRIRTENDLTHRKALVGTALRLARDDIPYVPLYRRTLNWAMQRRVTHVTMWPDDTLPAQWVVVK